MKKNIKLLFALLFVGVLAFFSTRNTINGHGILTGDNLDPQVLAQKGTTGSGSSGGGSGGGTSDEGVMHPTCFFNVKIKDGGGLFVRECDTRTTNNTFYKCVPPTAETNKKPSKEGLCEPV